MSAIKPLSTITITKSVDVEIEAIETERGDTAWVATIPASDYIEARVVAKAYIYEREGRGYTVTGSFVDNYAVEAKVRKAVEGSLTVQFDSESGQFFAYVRSFDAAIILARKVAEAAVEVALEAGEL